MRSYILIPLFILSLSLICRFYNLQNHIWWVHHTVRELLIGYHIAVYNEFPKIGSISLYLDSQYPPYFYYLIGLVTKINTDPWFILGVFVVMGGFLPLILYFIGKKLFSTEIGVLCGILAALSANMIVRSNLWAPFVSVPVFYFGLLLKIYGNNGHNKLTFIGYFFMLFSSTIHYSALVLTILILIFDLIYKKSLAAKVNTIFFIFCMLILLYVPVVQQNELRGVFHAYSPRHNLEISVLSAYRFLTTMRGIWLTMFNGNTMYALAGAISALFLLLINLKKKSRISVTIRTENNWVFRFLTLILLTILLGSLKKSRMVETYAYGIIFPTILLLLSWLCVTAWHKSNTLMKFFTAIATIGIIVGVTDDFRAIRYNMGSNFYQQSERITDHLYREAGKMGIQSDYLLFGGNDQTNVTWGSTVYWYFMETKYKRKMTRVVNHVLNLDPLVNSNKSGFLVCKGHVEYIQTLCPNEFIKKYSQFHIEKEIPSLYIDYSIYYFAPIGN